MSSYLQALKLIELRKKHNYTQNEISKYLQMTRAGYSQYELGKRTPTTDVLLSLAQLYRIDIEELINIELIISGITTDKSLGIISDAKSLHTLGIKCLKTKPKLDLHIINNSDVDFLIKFTKLDAVSQSRITLYMKMLLKQQKKADVNEMEQTDEQTFTSTQTN